VFVIGVMMLSQYSYPWIQAE